MSIKNGLVLAGGGARAAYQVGVLQALAQIFPPGTQQPFPVITGTSAGALNALGLAGRPGSFRYRSRALATMWGSLESGSVYRTDVPGVAKNAARVAWSLVRPERFRRRSLALLDNSPLRELLEDVVQFTEIERALIAGELEAIGVTAVNYSSGQSNTFYQGQAHLQPWQRARRMGIPAKISVEHLLASSALPTLFPATTIDGQYFGDGALRQSRPLSPAIHLGADRLLIVGVSDNNRDMDGDIQEFLPPSIPQVLGHMLNAVFLDSINTDLENLRRINSLIEPLNAKQLDASGVPNMRTIDTLTIQPSESLSNIALEYQHELPKSMRWFLRRTGNMQGSAANSALSYILFEPGYIQHLIELGFKDTLAQTETISTFFDIDRMPKAPKAAPLAGHGPVVKSPPGFLQRSWMKMIGKRDKRI